MSDNYGDRRRNGQPDQQPQRRFEVHISDEAYESEIRNDSAQLQRQHPQQRGNAHYGEPRNGQMRQYGDQRGQHNAGAPGLQRRDYPVSRTRVVTSRSGETYEIPEESNLPSKLLRRQKKNYKSTYNN